MDLINKHYREVKTVLRKARFTEPFMVSRVSFSPYMACQHGCMYCDGRAEKYYVEGEFDKDIVIRKNLPDILEKELSKLKEKTIITIGSGISDAYQPVEAEEKIMRKCAEILGRFDFSVSVMTKSGLVLRDLDLWAKVNEKAKFCLIVSLTFLDDDMRKIFEPGAGSVADRLSILKEFKKAGCSIGVLAMPFIPFISATLENVEALYSELTKIGVDFVIPAGLTLRSGKQKDLFINLIKKTFHQCLDGILNLYEEERRSGAPLNSYTQEFDSYLSDVALRYRIPMEIPHKVYKNTMPLYDELFVLLLHMTGLYSRRNVDIKALKKSFRRYEKWLDGEKRIYSRKRKAGIEEFAERFISMFKDGEMGKILGNQKLFEFSKKIVLERRTFDFVDLKVL